MDLYLRSSIRLNGAEHCPLTTSFVGADPSFNLSYVGPSPQNYFILVIQNIDQLKYR
jgi:hypothetical protein